MTSLLVTCFRVLVFVPAVMVFAPLLGAAGVIAYEVERYKILKGLSK